MKTKIFCYDTETTGIQPHRHGLHEISGFIIIDGELVDKVSIKMQPHPKAQIDPEALKVCGITEETLRSYQPMKAGFQELKTFLLKHVDPYNRLDKMHTCGYNNLAFDNRFLRRFFEYNNDNFFGSFFYSMGIDVAALMSYALRDERHKMKNFKLSTVAAHLGISVDESKLHSSFYDVELTYDLFQIYELL